MNAEANQNSENGRKTILCKFFLGKIKMQLEQRIVHCILQEWGAYEERHLDKSYYSTITPLWRYMTEGDTGKPVFTSTILSFGTPKTVLKIKQAIEKLPEQQKTIIAAQYVFHVKPNGGLWTAQEKAKKLGFSYSAWRKNLERARARLYPLI